MSTIGGNHQVNDFNAISGRPGTPLAVKSQAGRFVTEEASIEPDFENLAALSRQNHNDGSSILVKTVLEP